MGRMVHGETTSHFIGVAFEVHNTLGWTKALLLNFGAHASITDVWSYV